MYGFRGLNLEFTLLFLLKLYPLLCWEVYREENEIFDHRRKTRDKNRKHLVT